MTDQELLERRIRETLAERADGVAGTPALYERVRTGIDRERRRGAWRIGLGVAVAAAAVAVAVGGLPEPDRRLDIVDTPDAIEDPRTGEAESGTAGEAAPYGGVGLLVQERDELRLVSADGGEVFASSTSGGVAVDVGVAASWTLESGVAAVLVETPDGGRAVRVLEVVGGSIGGGAADVAVPTVNGDAIAVLPDGSAVAWVAGDELVLLATTADAGARAPVAVATLPTDDGGELVIRDSRATDTGVELLLTSADGRVWTVPLAGDADAPGGFTLAADATPVAGLDPVVDAVWVEDGRLLTASVLEDDHVGLLLRLEDGPAQQLDAEVPDDVRLRDAGGAQVVLAEPGVGRSRVLLLDADATEEFVTEVASTDAVVAAPVGASAAAWAAPRSTAAAADEARVAALATRADELRAQLDRLDAEIVTARMALDGAEGEARDDLLTTLDDLAVTRAKLAAEFRGVAGELAVLEAAADGQVAVGADLGLSFAVEPDGRLVSSGGNKPDPGGVPFADGSTLGLLAGTSVPSTTDWAVADLVAEVVRPDGSRELALLGVLPGGNSGMRPESSSARVEQLGTSTGLDGALTGLVRSPDGRHVAWTTAETFGWARLGDRPGSGFDRVTEGPTPSALPVVDWVWEDATPGDGGGVTGVVASIGFGAPGGGTERVTLDLVAPGPGSPRPTAVADVDLSVRVAGPDGRAAVHVVLPAALDVVAGLGADAPAPAAWAASAGELRATQVPAGVLVTLGDAAWLVEVDPDGDGGVRAPTPPEVRELPAGTRTRS